METLGASGEQRQFLLSFGEAYLASSSTNPQFEGSWYFPDGIEASVTKNEDEIEIRWTRNDKERTMIAHAQNRAAKITKYSRKDQYSSTNLADNGYAYLSENRQQMSVMVLKDNKHTFLTLERRT